MKNKSLRIPSIILAVGILAALAVCLLSCIVRTPAITEQEFPYAVTYTLDGETKTLEGVYECRFVRNGGGTDPLERYYEGEYLTNPTELPSSCHAIAQQGDLTLCVVIRLTDYYLMGDVADTKYSSELAIPYLAVFDAEQIEYMDEETVGQFDAGLVSWELPQPIENTFVFSGFCRLNDISMFSMLAVGVLVLLAVIVLVRRDKTIAYTNLDIAAVVLNFLVSLAAIPVMTLVVWLMQIFVSGDEIIYLIDLCIPALTAFTVAASVALRRKGFSKVGFFIQFAGPVLFVLMLLLEEILAV